MQAAYVDRMNPCFGILIYHEPEVFGFQIDIHKREYGEQGAGGDGVASLFLDENVFARVS